MKQLAVEKKNAAFRSPMTKASLKRPESSQLFDATKLPEAGA